MIAVIVAQLCRREHCWWLLCLVTFFRSPSGTLALKTEDFSKKIGRFSKTQK